MKTNLRDIRFDALKGTATCIVVFGHVMQYSIKGYEDSLIFNVIWSLQIPLFMIVSGYFSLSSKEITLGKLGNQLFRYLWPCVTYFIVLCVVYHYENPLLSAFNLLWHLEGTLWYLVVLAFFCVFNFFATKVSNKFPPMLQGIIYSGVFFTMTMLLTLPGFKLGLTFVGIKYVLYYSLFYWMGHMWHFLKNFCIANIEKSANIIFTIFTVVYLFIICNVNLYLTEDTFLGILPRVIASVCGIYIVCFSIMKLKVVRKFTRVIAAIGQSSLEIYYIHCVLVRSLEAQRMSVLSINGIITLAIGFIFIMGTTVVILKLVKQSEYLYRLIFGAKMKMGI